MAGWNKVGKWNSVPVLTAWNKVSKWNTYSGGSSGGTTPTIAAVSSIRGADIVTDEAQFTVTGTGLTGTTSVTVNGVAATAVTVVSDAEVTATAPHGFAAAYGSSGNVVANNGTASNAYAVTLMPPQGMNYTAFTVDYAGLDPNSPYAGNTEFSNITVGAQDAYDAQTTPDGIAVSMSGDGVFTLASQPTATQSFRTFIYDPTDQTVGANVTVTVEAVATATITSTGQTATDTQSATVSVIVSVNAGNQVAAETQSGAFSVQSLATITSSGQVAQDSQSSAFEAVTGITAGNQVAVDTQSGAFSVETTLQAGNQTAQDSQSGAFHVAPVSTLASTGQTATDSQSGGSFVLQVGGRRNINAQFPPGSAVTITLYDTTTGQSVPLLGSSMIEIGGAGLFLFDLDKIVDQPIRRTEYAWVATDGTTTQTGIAVIEPEVERVWQRLDLDPDNPNTYAEDVSEIIGAFGRLVKTSNGDGTVTVTRIP